MVLLSSFLLSSPPEVMPFDDHHLRSPVLLSPFLRASALINRDFFFSHGPEEAVLSLPGDDFRSVLGPPLAPCFPYHADFSRLPLLYAKAYGKYMTGFLLRFDVYYL